MKTAIPIVCVTMLLVGVGMVEAADVFNMPTGLTSLEFVAVGDPGNADDIHGDGYGGVGYAYRIGKYEVTNGQYREFLNAKAVVGDPYGVYSTDMTNIYGGIDRSGTGTVEDPYVYAAKGGDAGWDNKPVNVVCWYDAIRFANWLTNGQGNGDTESGSYTITNGGDNSGTVIVPDHSTFTTRHVVLTSEDEWYKAAYYKGGGINAGYWDYATQSDNAPIAETPPGGSNYANYNGVIGNVTEVGAYGLSHSAYGTFDQNGNVYEWNEGVQGPDRVFRGGEFYYANATHDLLASSRNEGDPGVGWSNVGFRVAEVPEPATLSLLTLGGLALVRRRKHGTSK